ncbi:hypothetical protein ACQP2H_03385 [Micromonospora sp. CA-248260]|uniref:hypothetical protein n=1 Tax=Micromonospora sp. CA-248260 TaxID=3239962 RepID=UPI003D93EEF4
MRAEMVFPDGAWQEVRFGLFEPTLDYSGSAWARDVLDPWVAAHSSILAALRQVGEPRMAAVALAHEDLWTLYALSRVMDLLILPGQPPATDPGDPTDWLPASAYRRFVAAIGGTFPAGEGFHPFLHEIVEVEPADDPQASPVLAGQWWPGCLVGSLLLMRGGVRVRAGADHLDPGLAATSTLYWAWRRRYRQVADLSHGWGSNSQWRTGFRRDYRLADRLVYNADAALDPTPPRPGGPDPSTDVDLLRYRCSTLIDHGDDQWVWDSHHVEPTAPTATPPE